MNRLRIFRIVLMIACIFAAGIVTGRYTTPPSATAAPAQFSGTAGRVITPRVLVQFFDQRLHLNPKQKQAILQEAQSFVGEIAQTEPETQERFDVFHRYYPRVRAHLAENQLSAFDAMVKTQKEKMAAILVKP
ncbi:MAG: hypothetical protein JNG86_01120 [Verrucomicrobiaceae bacterium]|nr:hypothetical protein [Verrucomicrobiaceae bacterium]